jgi:hypothetical protein
VGEAHGGEDRIDGGSSLLVGVGVADCDAPQSQRHRAFQDTAQPRKDCVHASGKIARGDIGRVRLGRCFRSLALTQVILEPSDLNSSSYASMFYVSSSFFVSAAVAGRLARSPHRYRNRICRTRSRPVNGASETVNASEEITRRTGLPLTRIALTAALPMTDVAIGGTAAGHRFRDRNTFGKDSA